MYNCLQMPYQQCEDCKGKKCVVSGGAPYRVEYPTTGSGVPKNQQEDIDRCPIKLRKRERAEAILRAWQNNQ